MIFRRAGAGGGGTVGAGRVVVEFMGVGGIGALPVVSCFRGTGVKPTDADQAEHAHERAGLHHPMRDLIREAYDPIRDGIRSFPFALAGDARKAR